MDEDAYFADALSAAKYAENCKHLEELLANKHKERCWDLKQVVCNVALLSIYLQQIFLLTATCNVALKISQTSSLDSFI